MIPAITAYPASTRLCPSFRAELCHVFYMQLLIENAARGGEIKGGAYLLH